MTKGKHWLILLGIAVIEAVLAFLCFISPHLGYFGLALVVVANLQWVVATILWFKNTKK